jgi:hypothetical protein
MTKQINVKVVCACGEEVTEEDIDKKLEVLVNAIHTLAERVESGAWNGVASETAQWLKLLDRPAEPEKKCACCTLNHPEPYSCEHCDPNYEKLDKLRTSAVC